MRKEVIDFLYEEYLNAIIYSNSHARAINADEFDVALAQDDFIADVMMMTMFALCADRNVTEAEVVKANSWLSEYGFEVDCDAAGEMLSFVKKGLVFEIPKVLIVLTLRSKIEMLSAEKGQPKSEALEAELSILNTVMCIFADIMCSSVSDDGLLPKEKEVIMTCMQKCSDHISDELLVNFDEHTNYHKIIERYC